ncbi:MAG: hypothetical protein MUF52_02015 [Syntrophobacteraceae bacterium]|nr:hypothetical protein [Syntrophobacteraceae bacterium]
MVVIDELLVKTCKNMIKTILFCLAEATKGTIYRIGPPPELQVIRVTSGVRVEGTDEIRWGLPSSSDYNYPGKSWEQYQDKPGRVLEAMGWCVEKQKSWTADNPYEDVRSVGKQLRGEIEDFHHMEPVLVRKADLYGESASSIEYPYDWQGYPIWQDTDYVVAAVIKIHFLPHAIKRDDRSTLVIQELSRSLGTELLTLHFREHLYRAQKDFARQRLHSCEILAHELRNAFIKFGFIFSAVNAVVGILREEWEARIREAVPELEWKDSILAKLNRILASRMATSELASGCQAAARTLMADQEELASVSILPSQAEQWIRNKIQPKWRRLMGDCPAWDEDRPEIEHLIEDLFHAIGLGMDQELIARLNHVPDEIREQWPRLVYSHFTGDHAHLLGDLIRLLNHPEMKLLHKHQYAKAFRSFKALAEVVPEVEERANRIILSLRYGHPTEAQTFQYLDAMPVTEESHERMKRDGESLALSE